MRVLRAIFATGAIWGVGLALHAELADGIKAIVHDSVITFQEVEDQTTQILPQQYRNPAQLDQKKLDQIRDESLEALLQRQLILHEFKTSGYSLPESIIDEEVQRTVAQYGGRATFTKSLQGRGITFEKLRQQIRDQLIDRSMRAKNVSGEIMISPHKIETYYLNHKDEYQLEDQVKLRRIVLNKTAPDDSEARQMAEEILAKIKDGASFVEMASVYSQGTDRSAGGDWGWVTRSMLLKELADVAFALKPGERSGVIETPNACFLVLVEESRAAHVKALGEVRNEIENVLLNQEHDRLQKQWIDRLKKKTFVRYF